MTVEPDTLAKRAVGRVVSARANDPNRAPRRNGFPEHLLYSFDADRVPDEVDVLQRQVRVFPLTPYAEQFAGSDRAAFNGEVNILRSLIRQKPFRVGKDIPVFPPVVVSQPVRALVRPIAFGGGTGIRFVTRCAREDKSANESLLYTFQGVTDDGRFLVSVFYPVSVQGGATTRHLAPTTRYLDAQPQGRFIPDLDRIDAMVRSIRVR